MEWSICISHPSAQSLLKAALTDSVTGSQSQMSLRLRQAVAGRPSRRSPQSFSTLSFGDKAHILYTSASNVILLNHHLALEETLPFWSALPHRAAASSTQEVDGVLGYSEERMVIAWSGIHVVIWQFVSTKKRVGWTVHSTIVASANIACLDYKQGDVGLLVLGTRAGMELWRTDPKADVVVWDRVWERSHQPPTSVQISETGTNIAWFVEGERIVDILTLNAKGAAVGIPQPLRHPRELSWIGWRKPRTTNGDVHLYTITTNQVLRIYAPVLDDPSWFQLLSSSDAATFEPETTGPHISVKGRSKGRQAPKLDGSLWIPDAGVMRRALADTLKGVADSAAEVDAETRKTLETLDAEENDVVAWCRGDGSLTLRLINNMDRKPPTLLKTQPLAAISQLEHRLPQWSPRAQLLHVGSVPTLLAVSPPDEADGSIQAYQISLPQLVASKASCIHPVFHLIKPQETSNVQLRSALSHFVRTPNGRGLLAVAADGEMAAFFKEQRGKVPKDELVPRALLGKALWTVDETPDECAIFAKGRGIVSYRKTKSGSELYLQHLDPSASSPSPPVPFPDFGVGQGESVSMLLAASDIDDGYSGRSRRTRRAFVIAATQGGDAWLWQVDSKSEVSTSSDIIDDRPDISLLSHYHLPVEGSVDGEHKAPHMIMPVDPMGWHQSVIDWKVETPLQDMILTVTEDGVLEFWTPRLGAHLSSDKADGHAPHVCVDEAIGHTAAVELPWRRTSVVRTGKANVVMARCSSRKKTVLIRHTADGRHELTIWDSNVSEFSTGLEHTGTYAEGELVQDLDWTTTSDLQSVLAVGMPHRIVLVCEQRMNDFEMNPGWAPFLSVDLERYTSVPINDSIWLAGGSLAVGCGNQIYVFSRFLDRETPVSSPAASVKSVMLGPDEPEDIFQLIAFKNGPLLDYHPVNLSQCLVWDKIELVKRILVTLANDLKDSEEKKRHGVHFRRLDPSAYFAVPKARRLSKLATRKYDGLFDARPNGVVEEDEDEFNDRLVADLIERLDGQLHLPLSYSEKALLATVAQATLEGERQRRALDLCGFRYLISIRMYVNQNRRSGTSGTVTPASGLQALGGIRTRPRLSFRNIVWATHSESQDVLLQAATECCPNGKMTWSDAKLWGAFLWLRSADAIRSQLEVIARNRFMADEERDPTTCSLIFFALGKKNIVHGLWRQAPRHKEQAMMLRFLGNDFQQERWKTAAMKNAYALLSKQRYEYAAGFFMLAGSPKDAINVCLRQLDDWQLAVALARVVEGGTDGPLMRWILGETVIPLAFSGGHRWLATWAFWMLGRRDLAVRVLISPMTEVMYAWSPNKPLDVGNPENDDPSLLLLFQHLKRKSLQTAKGTSEIAEKLEFDFVMHNARVFFRMGCHPLGLDLLRSWSFDRPFYPPPKSRTSRVSRITTPMPIPSSPGGPVPPTSARTRRPSLIESLSGSVPTRRRQSFTLAGTNKMESMVMDLDVLAESGESSRVSSPPPMDRPSPPPAFEGFNGYTMGAVPAKAVPNGDGVMDLGPEEGQIEKEVAPESEENKEKEEKEKEEKKEKDKVVEPEPDQPRKIGNLMKELKQDVQQGAMEFSMDSFDF